MLYVPLITDPPSVSAEQPTILEGTDLQQQQFATAYSRGEHLSDGGFETLDVHHPSPEAVQHHHNEWQAQK